MNDLYAWWRVAREGNLLPISVDCPECGFYRVSKHKGGSLLPLAIFPKDGEIIGHFDGQEIDRDRLNQLWPFAARNHVSEEDWREVAENGGKWPDIDASVHANGRGIGDNQPPSDPAELLKEQIESASAGVSDYATISDDATRDRAQTLRSRLLELSNEADKLRETLKRPHFEASKAVDAKWQPLVKAAKAAADTIRSALSAWETKKLRAAQEAQRKADEERRKIEATAPKSNEIHPIMAEAIAPFLLPTPQKFKGGAGRSASTSIVKVIKSVTDWTVLMAHFADRQELRDLVLSMAKSAVKAGHTVPGVETEDGVDVR